MDYHLTEGRCFRVFVHNQVPQQCDTLDNLPARLMVLSCYDDKLSQAANAKGSKTRIPQIANKPRERSSKRRGRGGLRRISPSCLSTVSAFARQGPAERPQLAHEIKHDGFRILARRDSAGVRLITREVCMSDPARVQGLVPEPPDDPQPAWPPSSGFCID